MKLSKTTILLSKILISAVLIVYLFFIRKIDISGVVLSLKEVNFLWLMAGLALLGLGRLITARRWQVILSSQQIDMPLGTLLISLFTANFFNLFLPSTIGGDAMRMYDISRYSRRPGTSVATILIERIMGIFALAIIALFSLLFARFFGKGFWEEYRMSALVWPVIGFFAVTLAGMLIVSSSGIAKAATYLLGKMRLGKIEEKVKKANEILYLLKSDRRCLRLSFFLSLLLQFNVIVYTYCIALSLNLKVSFILFCIIVPLVFTILLIPFSINGIGIRENAYVFFLGGVVLPSEAVALSWLLFFMTVVLGALGGVVYVTRREPH